MDLVLCTPQSTHIHDGNPTHLPSAEHMWPGGSYLQHAARTVASPSSKHAWGGVGWRGRGDMTARLVTSKHITLLPLKKAGASDQNVPFLTFNLTRFTWAPRNGLKIVSCSHGAMSRVEPSSHESVHACRTRTLSLTKESKWERVEVTTQTIQCTSSYLSTSIYSGTSLQRTLQIKDTSLMRTLSAVPTT